MVLVHNPTPNHLYLKVTIAKYVETFFCEMSYCLPEEESLRTHFEVLGLEAQVLRLKPYKSSKMCCPWLKDRIAFDWGPNPQITCNMTSSEIFTKRDFDGKKYLRMKHQKPMGPGLVRKQDVAKRGGLVQKVNVLKYVLNFIVEAR